MPARIHLCGELVVEWDGEVVTDRLPGRQGRLLFAFLVLHHDRPVRREELEEALGGAQLAPPLSRLRKALGEGRLEGRGELRLRLGEDAWIDWEVARDGVARARSALAAGAWADAWGPASAARAIADRGLLPGLEAEWLEPFRAELADLRIEALEALARTGVMLGGEELAPAERAARAAVEAAPFRESAHLALMDALAAQGNVAEALLAYEELRTLLRDELGTAPGAEVMARHAALLAAPTAAAPAAAPGGEAPGRAAAPPPAPSLVERDREVSALSGLLRAATSGDGGVVVIEGPAGVGKTRLLAELRAAASEQGARVLIARAGELERDFAFGVVRQLFEVEIAGRALDGAVAPAAAVLGAAPEGDTTMTFAALHGLYRLAVELAEEAPTLLAVDDVQWCDPASLRWLAYLARRLEGTRVLVAATLRSGEPATDAALLDELLREATSIRPGPLTPAAVGGLVRDVLGAEPDAAFARACHTATAGNPLLLRQLLTALRDDGVQPDAGGVGAVAEVGARAVSRSVLARLPEGTIEVARAIAVLGEGARLPEVAALARATAGGGSGAAAPTDDEATASAAPERAGAAAPTDDEATAAVAALARAEILRPEAELGFVHPLVRDAVYDDLTAAEREQRHGQAARLLHDRGAPADAVALHLLLVPPRGDAWTAGALREAGRAARRRGDLDSALAHLRRALAEPPPAGEHAGLLLELAELEREADAPAAAEHLRAVLPSLKGAERAAAAEALVWTLCFVGPPSDALPFMREVLPDVDDTDQRLRIEALAYFTAFWFGIHEDEAWFERLRAAPPRGDGPGAKMALAATAWQWAVSGGPADRCVPLAREALAGGTLLRHDPSLMTVAAATVLGAADDEQALAPWETLRRDAYEQGSMTVTVAVDLWRGWALAKRGELAEAEASLREALAGQVLWGLGPEVRAYTVGIVTDTLLERGDVEGVRALVEDAIEPPPGSDLRDSLVGGRAAVALAEGDAARAVAETDELLAAPGPASNPGWIPWRTTRALALHAVGRVEDAVALAWEDLGFAMRWGAPGTVGRALRVLGTVEGEAGVERLSEAVRVLEGSRARLEHARALAALALATGDPATVRRAEAAAEACGATKTRANLSGRA